MFNKTFIWGHRGSGFMGTQNTLSSFKNAINIGVDGLKTEVKLSKEGIVVLTFNDSLKINGKYDLIQNLTLEDIKKIKLNNGETIPTLYELFDEFKGYNIKYNFDISSPEVGIKVIEVANQYNLINQIELTKPAGYPYSLSTIFSKVREYNKFVTLCNSILLKYSNITKEHLELENMRNLNVDVININYNYANFSLFKMIKDLKYTFYIWGVLFERTMRKFLNMKYNGSYIDAMFSNQPERLVKLRNEIQN